MLFDESTPKCKLANIWATSIAHCCFLVTFTCSVIFTAARISKLLGGKMLFFPSAFRSRRYFISHVDSSFAILIFFVWIPPFIVAHLLSWIKRGHRYYKRVLRRAIVYDKRNFAGYFLQDLVDIRWRWRALTSTLRAQLLPGRLRGHVAPYARSSRPCRFSLTKLSTVLLHSSALFPRARTYKGIYVCT